MYLPLYITYPAWIHPQVFPNIPLLGLIRWYGLMYIAAFFTAYVVLKKELKEGALDTVDVKATEDDIFSFISTGIVFLLIGARVFSTLVYDTSGLYLRKPWLIFWPFGEDGQFTGLAGMSYHGGFIGGLLGMLFWCHHHKRPFFKWLDAMALAIPAGYTFGRIGNFLNGELYGRITTMPWGVVFPSAQKFSISFDWVRQIADKAGMKIPDGVTLVNLPRHPSQLYEALCEGCLLFVIMWLLRKRKPFDGFLASIYITGYGVFRFIIEYFREPDADLGYRIAKDSTAPIYMNTSLLNFSTGQILCSLMILGGITFGIVCFLRSKNKR